MRLTSECLHSNAESERSDGGGCGHDPPYSSVHVTFITSKSRNFSSLTPHFSSIAYRNHNIMANQHVTLLRAQI